MSANSSGEILSLDLRDNMEATHAILRDEKISDMAAKHICNDMTRRVAR